jgi:hypothetical protein
VAFAATGPGTVNARLVHRIMMRPDPPMPRPDEYPVGTDRRGARKSNNLRI